MGGHVLHTAADNDPVGSRASNSSQSISASLRGLGVVERCLQMLRCVRMLVGVDQLQGGEECWIGRRREQKRGAI